MANKFIIEIQTKGFNKATGDLDNLKKKTDQYGNSSKKMRLNTAGVRRELGKLRNNLLLVSFAFGAVVTAVNRTVAAYRKQLEAETRLRASLRNVASASEDGADKLMQLASALQQTTTFGDEQIISGQAMLATFQLNEDAIAALTPRMLDMAAALGTGGEGLTTIALQLGKAFTGQAGALSRSGVLIDKFGLNIARAQGPVAEFKFLIGELDKNFKGLAQELAQTTLGQIDQINNKISDLNEEIGRTAVPFKLAMTSAKKFVVEGLSLLTLATQIYLKETRAAHGTTIGWTMALVKAQQALAALRAGGKKMPEFGIDPKVAISLEAHIAAIKKSYIWWRLLGQVTEDGNLVMVEHNKEGVAFLARENPLLRKKAEIMSEIREQEEIIAEIRKTKDVAGKGLEPTIEQEAELVKLKIKQVQIDDAIFQAQAKGYANLSNSLSMLAGQFKHGAKVAARLAQAGAIIDMYAGANKAFKQGGVFGFVTGAAIITAGLANLAQIEAQLSSISGAARGADFVTSGPQMMMVGENPGGMERVQVTPLSSPNIDGPSGGGMTINFNNAVMSEDFTRDQIIPQIKKAVRLNLA